MDNDAVREGYERIADTYVAQRDQFKSLRHLSRFADLLLPGRSVLDIGCGGGLPADAYLVDHGFQVHGLDISSRMIEIARENVPTATYDIADMTELHPDQFAVDGILSLYAIFHTRRERHGELLETFASFLSPGRAMLITMGANQWEGTEDFHETEMSWSHFDAATNSNLVERTGFQVIVDEIDHSAGEQHQVIIARLAD